MRDSLASLSHTISFELQSERAQSLKQSAVRARVRFTFSNGFIDTQCVDPSLASSTPEMTKHSPFLEKAYAGNAFAKRGAIRSG
jgi:hypothetical protein